MSAHVLLANTYAMDGRWKDRAQVRMNIETKGLQKIPGISSITINGVTHSFVANDNLISIGKPKPVA